MDLARVVLPVLALLIHPSTGQEQQPIALVSSNTNGQTFVPPCVENGMRDLKASLNLKYPNCERFTSVIDNSRLGYSKLFTKDMADSLAGYCSLYKQKRNVISQCLDSPEKTIAQDSLALADDVCDHVDKYSKNMPCVVSVPDTTLTCNPNCSQFEAASQAYINAQRSADPTLKGADCNYLKCEADCRQKIIQNHCDLEASNLEADALNAIFSQERISLGRNNQMILPECRAMITLVKMKADPAPAPAAAAATTVVGAASGAVTAASAGASAAASGVTVAAAGPASGVTMASAAAGATVAAAAGSANGSAPAAAPAAATGTNGSAPAPASGNGTASAPSAASGNGTAGSPTAAAPPPGGAAAPAASPAASPPAAPAPAPAPPKSGATAPRADKIAYHTAMAAAGLVAAIIL